MDSRIYDGFDKYRIGLRNIKTALAVLLCLLISLIFPSISPLNAGIAAIVCMQPTPGKTIETGINRFIGTMIGGVFGYVLIVLSTIIPRYDDYLFVLAIPTLMTLCISTCVWLKKYDSVVICCVVYLIIALEIGDNTGSAINYVAMRILDTIIGIGLATFINKYIFPYKGKAREQ